MASKDTLDVLLEKWDGHINSDKFPEIQDEHKKKVTAQLLENTDEVLMEAGEPTQSVTNGGVDNYDPILIKLVRRMAPKLIAYDICGLQPMRGPTGLIFALRSRYNNPSGAEALHDEADTSHSGKGTHAETDPFSPTYATGVPLTTSEGEGTDNWNEMAFSIERTSVTAETRQLRATYSLEFAQDLRAVHGLDADNELTNILQTELVAEINRHVVRTMYSVAKPGAQFATTAGTFDLAADSDGRWSVEKFKGLIFAIQRDANAIAIDTRRGKGNVIVCSPDVASALEVAGKLDSASALNNNLMVDPTGATFAGTMMAGRVKVFVDPYATGDFYVVGYKGANQYDAGFFYCPYVPLQMVRATYEQSFQPAVGFKTRYGLVSNPFTDLATNSNSYYRKVRVTNLQ